MKRLGYHRFIYNYNNRGLDCIVLGMAHTLNVLPIGFGVIAVTTLVMMVFSLELLPSKHLQIFKWSFESIDNAFGRTCLGVLMCSATTATLDIIYNLTIQGPATLVICLLP